MGTPAEQQVALAERALAEAQGVALGLALDEDLSDEPGGPSSVLRCRVTRGPPDAPASVIVKVVDPELGLFAIEWAGLEFLASSPDTVRLVPRVLGCDPERCLTILEDLGSADDLGLGEILEGTDVARARAALIEFHRTLGRLHAGTIGRRGEYEALRKRVGTGGRSRHRVHELVERLEVFERLPEEHDLIRPAGLAHEVETAIDEIRRPGGFLAFTHGDSTPANAIFDGSRVVLFDLEASGYRHALLDGSFPRIRYIHSLWARRIPLEVQRSLVDEYRRELVPGCPEAADDDRFDRAMACCGAGWLAGVLGLLPSVVERDRRWGVSTNRQRVIAALDHFASLSAELGRLPAIAAISAALAQQLRERWPESDCTLPLYRAFSAP